MASAVPLIGGTFPAKLVVVAVLVVLVTAVVGGMSVLENYVHQITRDRDVQLTIQLKDPPAWLSSEMIEDICLSCGIHRDDFLLDGHLPPIWAENLKKNPWVQHVKTIHKHYDGRVELDCQIRRPIAEILQNGERFFIDLEGVVLPDAAVQGHVVRLLGVAKGLPEPGEMVTSAALIGGLEILQLILQVDEKLNRTDWLWDELAALDVSNYEGKINPDKSHLTLYTTGQTPIFWGAALGRTIAYHEASQKDKLTTLYRHHRQAGSLDRYRYIDLRNFRKEKSDPLRNQAGVEVADGQ